MRVLLQVFREDPDFQAVADGFTRGLRERGVETEFIYGFDDYDPLDAVPPYLDREQFAPYLGVPLANVPAPPPGAASFADFYSRRFIEVYERLGCSPTPYWGSDLYRGGRMNEAIRRVLVGGEPIVEDGRPVRVDEDAIRAEVARVTAGWAPPPR